MNDSLPTGLNGQPRLSAPVPLNQRGIVELAVCSVLMTISTLAVILRLVARKVKGASFAADDYIIVVALVCLLSNGSAEIVGTTLGGRGYHQKELSPEVITFSLKSLYAAAVSWTLCTSAIKMSLLLLYIRVFPGRPFRLTAYALMAVVALYCISCTIVYTGNCRPVEANWIPNLPGSVCGNQKAGWLGTGLANVVTDIAVLSLPMRSVYHLQLPPRTRAAVAGVFGIGFITVVVSIVRLVSLVWIDPDDFTYTAVPADILSAFEPGLMITCACLPQMRPLFRSLFPTRSRSKYGHDYGNDRTSLYGHNRAVKDVDAVNMQMKPVKSKHSPAKHKSIVIPESEGFERLPDLDLGTARTAGDEKPGLMGLLNPKDRFLHAPAKAKSRSTSPAFASGEGRSETPLPKNGIEVTTEWTVEHE